ncbi:MAG TPA: thioredoxin family protein [Lentimicrobium sp.]|jgi:small redox-active disulfide protein 2|nr:thioredoxin family protein [Lentimicrobium sp.]
MEIKVLGPGCPNCKILEKRVRDVVGRLKLEADVRKVDDIMEIMAYNVIKTPALVVDGEVVVKGRLPSEAEIETFLTK